MSTFIACPNCHRDLRQTATASLYEITPADANAEADLILECSYCGKGWNAFVSMKEFLDSPIEEGTS